MITNRIGARTLTSVVIFAGGWFSGVGDGRYIEAMMID
jgi:hypothetical protein